MESHEKEDKSGPVRDKMTTLELRNGNRENGIAPADKPQIKDLDDLLPYVGDFGWYQRFLFFMMIPYAFFFAFVYFAQIFMTVVPAEHWCLVEELRNLSVEERTWASHKEIRSCENVAILATLGDGLDSAVYWLHELPTLLPVESILKDRNLLDLGKEWRRHLSAPLTDNQYSKCQVYDVDWKNILEQGIKEPDVTWPVKACDRWEYNFTDIPYETIATQLGWVCDRDNYPATAQSVFFGGAIIGGLIFGWIADKYGRVPALLGTNMIGFAAGVGTAFSNSFWSFCLCRFLVGIAYDNCFIIMYIIVLEYVGPKWRTFVANMSIAVYFTFAACLLPWIALAVADWKIYTLITSVPLGLSFLTPWVVPESARWLISQNRIEEAIKIMNKVERINKKKIPDAVIKEFRETAAEIARTEQEIKNYSAADLFKTPRLRRHSILLILIWMSIAMVFDGHVRNVGSLGLDMFVTFTVATATEFPADILLIMTLDTVGRRWTSFGSMVVSGIFSVLAAAVPIGIPTASLAIVGRFAVNISFNIGMQYAAELLPTVVRAQGLALIHIMGYVATILVPYIVYLANINTIIPLLILGALGVFGGTLCLFLPESTGKDMPQTIQEGEEYGKGQSFWTIPRIKSKKTKENEA